MENTLTLQKNGHVSPTRKAWQTTCTPRVDIRETEEDLWLYLDVPGVRPEDLDLRFERSELTIHAQVAPRTEAEPAHREQQTCAYHRVFRIHEDVDVNGIEATLKYGVLTLRLPKAERVKPRRIAVQGN